MLFLVCFYVAIIGISVIAWLFSRRLAVDWENKEPRRLIASTMPPALRSFLGKIRAYLHRMLDWALVWFQVSGETRADRRVLRRALMAAPMDSFRRLDIWREPRVPVDIRVSSRLGRFRVRANSEDLYMALPWREEEVTRAIRSVLGPGDVFVDAGANIGVYTVYASRLGTRVVAVEMIPETAQILRTHISDNDCRNVTVVEAALSDRSGDTVRATVTPGKYGQAHLSDVGEIIVQTATLADVLADIPHVRLIKMDLEGAETAAIRGLGDVRPDHIIFEDWGGDEASILLSSMGYSVSRLDADNSIATSRGISAIRR